MISQKTVKEAPSKITETWNQSDLVRLIGPLECTNCVATIFLGFPHRVAAKRQFSENPFPRVPPLPLQPYWQNIVCSWILTATRSSCTSCRSGAPPARRKWPSRCSSRLCVSRAISNSRRKWVCQGTHVIWYGHFGQWIVVTDYFYSDKQIFTCLDILFHMFWRTMNCLKR